MSKKENLRKNKRSFSGKVVSDKGKKTIIVEVKRIKLHRKYLKRYSLSKRYKVHDEENQYKVGDLVTFVECRPLSKEKRWRVLH